MTVVHSWELAAEKSRSELRWYHSIGDFANLFKAFIGTNYLTLSYGLKQSGLGLGIVFYIIIASLTDHCCQLIVRCKYLLIDDLCYKEMYKKHNQRNSDSEEEEASENVAILRQRLMENLNYADIGKLVLGKYGDLLVNFFLALTQTGFCVNYYIFVGNTLHGLFQPGVQAPTVNMSLIENYSVTTESNVVRDSLGGQTQSQILNAVFASENSTRANITSSSMDTNSTLMSSTSLPYSAFSILLSTNDVFPTTSNWSDTNSSDIIPRDVSSFGPPLPLLVLSPMPIYIAFTLFRNVRQMSVVSFIANLASLIGYGSVLIYILSDFEVRNDLAWFRWSTVPIFIGQLTASYEAIGTIIPIESSMKGNHHRFPSFLHGTILAFTGMIASLSFIGYINYGEDTEQILSLNLPSDDGISIVINITLILGILCTYPLQIYPVIEILEDKLFQKGRLCGPSPVSSHQKDERHPLLSSTSSTFDNIGFDKSYALEIPKSVPAWKRNTLRIVVTILVGGAAILFRNVFAYFNALIGSIGSCPLAFIIPCLLHFIIVRQTESYYVLVKDIVIMVIGFLLCITSVTVSIQQMIQFIG